MDANLSTNQISENSFLPTHFPFWPTQLSHNLDRSECHFSLFSFFVSLLLLHLVKMNTSDCLHYSNDYSIHLLKHLKHFKLLRNLKKQTKSIKTTVWWSQTTLEKNRDGAPGRSFVATKTPQTILTLLWHIPITHTNLQWFWGMLSLNFSLHQCFTIYHHSNL